MPKLPNQFICARASDDTELTLESECFVDSEGVFSIVIDSRIMDSTDEMSEQHTKWPGISVKNLKGKWRACGNTLESVIKFLNAAALNSISGTESCERVILYNLQTSVSFWVNEDGTLHPNGGSPEAGKGNWWKAIVNDSRLSSRDLTDFFSVGMTAFVFDKIITTRSTGTTIRYERVRAEHQNDEQESTPWGRLNSFCSLTSDPECPDLKQMPYSDEAALFFYDTLLALCKIAKNMDSFFGDEKRLKKAIATRTNFLLTAPK